MTSSESCQCLPAAFFARDTVLVARALIGQRLIRVWNGRRLGGPICETEAYRGAEDQASHAYRRTPRSAIMYGPPGRAYVYFIYGMYYCLNVVTEAEGIPGAVLIRGIIPAEGLDLIRAARSTTKSRHLTDGPGRLCQALSITTSVNGQNLSKEGALFLEAGTAVEDREIMTTARIGVRGDAMTRSQPWRFVWSRPSPGATT